MSDVVIWYLIRCAMMSNHKRNNKSGHNDHWSSIRIVLPWRATLWSKMGQTQPQSGTIRRISTTTTKITADHSESCSLEFPLMKISVTRFIIERYHKRLMKLRQVVPHVGTQCLSGVSMHSVEDCLHQLHTSSYGFTVSLPWPVQLLPECRIYGSLLW